MQEFFMNYGLWLLIALLVIIGLVILLSGKRKDADGFADRDEPTSLTPSPPVQSTPVQPTPIQPVISPAPLAPAEPLAVPPQPVAPSQPVAREAAPATQPVSVPPSPAATTEPAGGADELLKLKGVGPKLKALLIELGVTRFAQIAAWTESDIAAIDTRLGTFKGRPVRDQWVDQAKYLAAGDIAGFEAKYGKL